MVAKLDVLALGYAFAIIYALIMLLLGILGNIGIYTDAAEIMQRFHMFFSLSITGIIAGMIEAAILGFIFAYVFGLIYNRLARY